MAEMKQSATQRIQVGLIGLVIVLLFVSLANMALEKANEEPPQPVAHHAIPAGMPPTENEAAPGEPLAELGVTPVAKENPQLPGAPDAGAANVKATPAKPQ